MDTYDVTYVDKFGEESALLFNDGESLRMTLRGVQFHSEDFDSFEPDPATSPELLGRFNFDGSWLCDFSLMWDMPVVLLVGQEPTNINLHVNIALGGAQTEFEMVQLKVQYKGQWFESRGTSGWFEDEMLQLRKQLPARARLKVCFECAYSDYSPFGHGLFGNMICFRNLKEEYLQVSSKEEFWPVHDRSDRMVQETFCCDDWAPRAPGTGYRG